MVMEFIRRAGWNCWSGSPSTQREFQRLVDAKEFAVIGISVSADLHIQGASDLITSIRKSSRNRDTVILAGGRAMLENPALATEIGADAMAADGREAVQLINRLCRNTTGRSE